jgi:hypothetical protein
MFCFNFPPNYDGNIIRILQSNIIFDILSKYIIIKRQFEQL